MRVHEKRSEWEEERWESVLSQSSLGSVGVKEDIFTCDKA
jgi:hypothetical protein